MEKIIYIILLIFSALGTFFGFKAGKNNKENEILKNNANKQKKYNQKPTINSDDDLYDKLSKGNF
jgi:hypothetical protein